MRNLAKCSLVNFRLCSWTRTRKYAFSEAKEFHDLQNYSLKEVLASSSISPSDFQKLSSCITWANLNRFQVCQSRPPHFAKRYA